MGESGAQKPKKAEKQFSLEEFEHVKTLGKKKTSSQRSDAGHGTFGKVKLVRSTKDEEAYALKIMRKEDILKNKQIEHIKNEKAVLLNYAKSDFFVKCFETLSDDTNLYLVMEYIAGGELFSVIK